MRSSRSSEFGIFGMLFLASQTAYANIIDDTFGIGAGSFELGNFVNGGQDGGSFGGTGWMGLGVGSIVMTGWTVGGPGDGVDWLTTPTFGAAAQEDVP